MPRTTNTEYDITSVVIQRLKENEVLVLGQHKGKGIILVARYNGNLRLIKNKIVPFGYATRVDSTKKIYAKCDVGALWKKTKEYELDIVYSYVDFIYLDKGQVLEIGGAELYPMDIIWVYNLRDFSRCMAVLIGEDLALLVTGEVKSINLVQKLTEQELKDYSVGVNNLKLLYRTMYQEKVRKDVREFRVGDIYKKGDMISIYLGKRSLQFHADKARLAVQKTRIIDGGDLESFYANKDKTHDLWFRVKMSQSNKLKYYILELLANKQVDITTDDILKLIYDNLGTYNIHTLRMYGWSCVRIYAPITSLKYDIKKGILGSYVTHLDLDEEKLLNYCFRVNTGGAKEYRVVKESITFYLD